jgi:hypothetical protein
MGTLRNFAVTLVIFSAVTVLFTNFMGGMATTYNTTAYTNNTFSTYNKLQDMVDYTNTLQANTLNAKRSDVSFSDLITGYFTSAWQSLILAVTSFNIFSDVWNGMMADLNLGFAGTILTVTVITIVLLVLIFKLIGMLAGGRDV